MIGFNTELMCGKRAPHNNLCLLDGEFALRQEEKDCIHSVSLSNGFSCQIILIFHRERKKKFSMNQGVWQTALPFNYFSTMHVLEIDSVGKRVHCEPESSEGFCFVFCDDVLQ